MELRLLICDGCGVEEKATPEVLPEGWTHTRPSPDKRKTLHFCEECTGEVIRHLTAIAINFG